MYIVCGGMNTGDDTVSSVYILFCVRPPERAINATAPSYMLSRLDRFLRRLSFSFLLFLIILGGDIGSFLGIGQTMLSTSAMSSPTLFPKKMEPS